MAVSKAYRDKAPLLTGHRSSSSGQWISLRSADLVGGPREEGGILPGGRCPDVQPVCIHLAGRIRPAASGDNDTVSNIVAA